MSYLNGYNVFTVLDDLGLRKRDVSRSMFLDLDLRSGLIQHRVKAHVLLVLLWVCKVGVLV